MMKSLLDVSIVVPIYNEQDNIQLLYDRLHSVMQSTHKSYELVLVNDGSQDNTEKVIHALHKKDPEHVKLINFNGNFGQHMAVMAGFEHSVGETMVTLDADLQNPPEEIPKLLALIDAGHDLVEGVRKIRKDNAFRRYASKINNRLREKITGIKLKDQGSMLRAYSRRVTDLMVMSKERSTFIPALAYSYASNPGFVDVEHAERAHGTSQYNLYRLFRLSFDLMTGFSQAPLQLVTFTGLGVSFLSFLFVIYLLIRRIVIGPEAEGVFTLFAIVFFLCGLILFCLGVLGEYIGRIYQEARKRPRYVIKERLLPRAQNNDEQ
jgi:undecaprenyl-phosphate 4-deoxy-4-formamido-L-arabinose transferase